jgi:minor extracellular serine protease Vpr
VVLRAATGAVSLGCDPAEYTAAGVAGKLVVTQRGTCARVARAIYGQKAGAAAVALIDNTTGYPPIEGTITSNPDTGEQFTVTIPFFGVRGLASTPTSDGGMLAAASSVTVGPATQIPNQNYLGVASFSSSGPRTGDSALKPDITAPGVSIVSTGSGTGNAAATISGTSMAAPHVTGVAALTRQAHPNWNVAAIKSAIVNTGDPAQVKGYRTSRAGTGLVQPGMSTVTQVVAQSEGGKFLSALNFGFNEINRDLKDSTTVVLRNLGSTPAAFGVSSVLSAGSPHTIDLSRSSVTVPAHGSAEVKVTLTVPVATAGASNGAGLSFQEVAGIVQFTPADAATNGGAVLRVPYYLVPRALSDVSTSIGRLSGTDPSTTAKITNRHGAIPGDADFYAWGLEDKKDPGRVSNDVRAVGVQSFPFPTSTDPNAQLMVFAVNTFDRWSNASTNEFDIYIDVDGDGVDDYVVVGADQGLVTAGASNGLMGVFVFSLHSDAATMSRFAAAAPTDSSTALLPVLSTQLCLPNEPCLSASNPRITYHAVSFDLINSGVDEVKGSAKFNVWANAISTGGFATVPPGATDTSVPIAVNSDEWKLTPAKGLMIVTFDNKSGGDEAQLIPVRFDH